MSSFKRSLGIYLRGIAMGAADVVPGVSGGTIAFISGIYEELLNTIKGFNLEALKTLKKEGVAAAWKKLNLNFIIALGFGIVTSIVSLAGFISSILEEEGETVAKIRLWSFFFGLIIASVWYIGKQVKTWNLKNISGIVAGAILAFLITIAPVGGDSDNLIFLFFAGCIAISAMILPGISGSFILVLIGAYKPVMGAIKGLSTAVKASDFGALTEPLSIIAVVGVGCVVGLLSFSRLLSYLFAKHEKVTLSVLTGFMIGSLNKIWPWKKAASTRLNSDGEIVPVQFENLSPASYMENFHLTEAHVLDATLFALAGLLIVLVLEYAGMKLKNDDN